MGRPFLSALQKCLQLLFMVSLWSQFAFCGRADVPIQVKDSGSKTVDALVVKLVSERPAPFPSAYSGLEIVKREFFSGYMTIQVSNSIASLKQMGPSIFPALMKHLYDDRYSYSMILAVWNNETVGDAVVEVLCDGHHMYSGYKWRDTPSGSVGYLSFPDYLKAKEPKKWAEWARDKTKLEIQLDFIDWCVAKEEERGFVDEAQKKKLLDTYQQAREKVKKEYSNDKGTKKLQGNN